MHAFQSGPRLYGFHPYEKMQELREGPVFRSTGNTLVTAICTPRAKPAMQIELHEGGWGRLPAFAAGAKDYQLQARLFSRDCQPCCI